MKLRTIEEFEDAVSRETAWRRKELTTLLHQTQSARSHAEGMMLRAGLALLYAHWEGFIKAVGRLYVAFVSQRRLKYNELSAAFLALALKSKLTLMEEARAAHIHIDLARFLQERLGDRATLREELVDTQANLSSAVLRDIVTRLGLPYAPYELREHLIDARLLDRRNTIAHGKELDLEPSDFAELHRAVSEMMSAFQNDVLVAAGSRHYRSRAPV